MESQIESASIRENPRLYGVDMQDIAKFVALAYDDRAGQTKICLNTKLATRTFASPRRQTATPLNYQPARGVRDLDDIQ